MCHYTKTDDFETAGADRSKIMKECMESLFENTDYPAEVIVVDNGGSPDDTDYFVQKVREGKINTLIRYKENLKFSFAWNQGARIATGKYLLFTCNDIKFKPKWLSTCVNLLEKYPSRKFIATPLMTPDKDKPNFNKEIIDGNRVNSMAGSNCMLMTYATWREVGEFPHHRIGGSLWHRIMNHRGYWAILPPEDLAEHVAYRKGVNWHLKAPCERKLLNGEIVDFHYANYENHIYAGSQKDAGAPL